MDRLIEMFPDIFLKNAPTIFEEFLKDGRWRIGIDNAYCYFEEKANLLYKEDVQRVEVSIYSFS